MDISVFTKFLEVGSNFGLPGLILILWYLNDRRYAKLMDEYQKKTAEVLRQYRDDFHAVKQMYENNVELVKGYSSLSEALHDTLLLTASKLQGVEDAVKTNQFCPYVRLEKQSKGPQS